MDSKLKESPVAGPHMQKLDVKCLVQVQQKSQNPFLLHLGGHLDSQPHCWQSLILITWLLHLCFESCECNVKQFDIDVAHFYSLEKMMRECVW